MRVVRKCRTSSPWRAVGVDDDDARASAVGFSSFIISARVVFFFFRHAAPILEKTCPCLSASVRRSADIIIRRRSSFFVFRRRERGSVTQKFGTIAIHENQ